MRQWANLAKYHYRRIRWLLRADLLLRDAPVDIDDPIFILGVQGSGATIVSRMLRRSPEVVTLSGNYRYWAGADEMQTAFDWVLPHKFSGLLGNEPANKLFSSRRGWVYASDELLSHYCYGADAYDMTEARRFRRILKLCIFMNAPQGLKRVRFLDKSQSYALKVPLLRQVLSDTNPRFVVLTRNPWAACWRAAAVTTHLSQAPLPLAKRVEIAAEHWFNTYSRAIEAEGVTVFRIEDILHRSEETLRRICDAVDIPFDLDYLPSADHHIPFGTKRGKRWYPIREDVNGPYLRNVPMEAVQAIGKKCGALAARLGYSDARSD